VYKEKLTGVVSKAKFASLFSGSGSFVDSPKAIFDFLVIDEAHRLNEKSGLYGNLGENQIKEVINSSNCAIFFLDEDQRVTLKDIGSKEVISAYANARGATVEEYRLESQFRCSGSDGYIAWLDRVLGIRETVSDQVSLEKYDFRVFDDPEDLHSEIARLNDNNRARVVAGYCWPWSSKKDPNSSDLVIGGYKRKWNLGSDGSLWIISPTSVEQVGCIHTCQGLEVDYIGVIIGPDLIVRDGVVLTDPNKRDRHDKTVRGHKSMSKLDPVATHELTDRIIKNTYRTLMTRGMKGCFIYATDSETSDYFKSLLKSSGLTSSTST
jgi:DUF2075 family protein